jgi:predicted NBD/HSP70 family sugar kinase
MPLFEYVAAAELRSRLKEDAGNAFFTTLGVQSIDCHGWLHPIIEYHKIAALTLGKRLRERVYREILDKGRSTFDRFHSLLGLVAAAAYDTPGEDQDARKYDRVAEIFRIWADQKTPYVEHIPITNQELKQETSNLIILYDIPLCSYDEKDLSRSGFRDGVLENFLQFWWSEKPDGASPGSPWRFVSFHYEQAKLLSYDISTPTEPGRITQDLASGKRLRDRYEFVPYHYDDKASSSLPKVHEFRLKEHHAFPELLGSNAMISGTAFARSWERMLDVMSTKTASTPFRDLPNFYPTPLRDYMSLPLLQRLLRYASEYSPQHFQKLTYQYDGQLDRYFPRSCDTFAPDQTTPSCQPTIEKYLAALATNIGVSVGYDRIWVTSSKDTPIRWPDIIHNLLMDRDCGYELLLRYVETFMRSHEVVPVAPGQRLDQAAYNKVLGDEQRSQDAIAFIADTRPEAQSFCAGVDIGATSIKFKLYDSLGEAKATYRLGTAPRDQQYPTLKEFARVLIDGVDKLFAKAGSWQQLDSVGISWPGVIRDQKIAGASGILRNFSDAVASNWIRRNTVEKIRSLDLISDLRAILEERKIESSVVFAMANDGYAEALGRLLKGQVRDNTWAVLKLGTGTAGAVISKGYILGGPSEFGKLVLNVCEKDGHKLKTADNLPKGDLNKYASANLLPIVFREVANVPDEEDFDFNSLEIGLIGSFYLPGASKLQGNVKQLSFELGLDHIYRIKMQAFCSKEEFREVCIGSRSIDSFVKDAMKLKDGADLRAMCINDGELRYDEYVKWPFRIFEELGMGKRNFTDCAQEMFAEVFDRAGSLLADGLMLLRDMYRVDGVVLCGGVLDPSTASTARILASIRLHLDRKYHVRFADFDQYLDDCADKLVRKRSISTLYHNFPRDLGTVDHSDSETATEDYGEHGAIYHAKLIKYVQRPQPD